MYNRLLPLLCVSLGASAAHAQSFLKYYFANDLISFRTDASATYSAGGLTSTAASLASSSGGGGLIGSPAGVSGPVGPLGLALSSGAAPLSSSVFLADISSLTPDSGLPKDYISSHSEFQYHVGDATTADSFSLVLNAHVSAQAAQLSGANADAQLVVSWHLNLEPGSFAAATQFTFPDLTALNSQGVWSANWVQHLAAGSNSIDVTHGGSEPEQQTGFYSYDVTYTLDVPYGTDPDINVTLNGGVTVTPVPEVDAVWQMSLLALPAWLLLRRRR